MEKKTDAMIFLVICVAFGNAAHFRTIMGLAQVAGKVSTRNDFGNMVAGHPTLLVLHGFCFFFMLVAAALLLKTRTIVLRNHQEKMTCLKLNSYLELLVGATIGSEQRIKRNEFSLC